MALKSIDGNGFDDELFSTEIAYLAKNFRNFLWNNNRRARGKNNAEPRNFLRNNNRRARGKNNAEPRNFKRNEPTKVNNFEKSKGKVGQTSNNSLGQQYFGCQGYGHVKSECPTFLRSKGKTMVITLSDDEVSDHESSSDDDGNFITFTTIAVVDKSVVVEENSSDGKLSECADLQEVFNKLCKVAAKNAMNVDLGLKKMYVFRLLKTQPN